MERVILARIGEIALKGLNRSVFERRLAVNIRKMISDLGPAKVRWSQSRFYIEPEDDTTDEVHLDDQDKAPDKKISYQNAENYNYKKQTPGNI